MLSVFPDFITVENLKIRVLARHAFFSNRLLVLLRREEQSHAPRLPSLPYRGAPSAAFLDTGAHNDKTLLRLVAERPCALGLCGAFQLLHHRLPSPELLSLQCNLGGIFLFRTYLVFHN